MQVVPALIAEAKTALADITGPLVSSGETINNGTVDKERISTATAATAEANSNSRRWRLREAALLWWALNM